MIHPTTKPKRGTPFFWTTKGIDVWLNRVVRFDDYYVCEIPDFDASTLEQFHHVSPEELEGKKKVGSGIMVNKPKKNLAPVSKNMQASLAKYRRLRDKYFEENPICEFPACNSKKITLHHKRGRIGEFLTDKRHFCSLCQKHHRWVEENPLEAKKMGLSDSRL